MGRDKQDVSESQEVEKGWLYEIIDILAYSYGWTMDYILDSVHLGDLLGFLSSIERRKRNDALLSLAITHNPFSKDPNALFKELKGTRTNTFDNKFDKEGMNKLRKELTKSKVIKVKE
jgi:hypothetical protein